MKRVLRAFLGPALCLCLASAVAMAAPPRGAEGRYSVGDFAVQMARAMSLPAASVNDAVASLQGSNVRVNGNLGRDLVEGDLVNLLSQAGIVVTTSDPSRKVNRSRATEILLTFQAELSKRSAGPVGVNEQVISSTNPTNPNDDFNNGNGRGGKFKRKKKNSQTGSD